APLIAMRATSIIYTTALIVIAAACAAARPTTAPPPDDGGDGGDGGGDATLVISKVSGDAQQATLGAALASPLVVAVTNSRGAAMQGVTVTWTAAPGNGTLSAGTSVTDGSGHASARWTLDPT